MLFVEQPLLGFNAGLETSYAVDFLSNDRAQVCPAVPPESSSSSTCELALVGVWKDRPRSS